MLGKKQKINESEVMKFGFLAGVAEASYCFLVALLISILEETMPRPPHPIISPLAVLLLFVFSAAVSGILVFCYPAYLALQKRYTEAFMTAMITVVTLAIIGILVFILISLI